MGVRARNLENAIIRAVCRRNKVIKIEVVRWEIRDTGLDSDVGWFAGVPRGRAFRRDGRNGLLSFMLSMEKVFRLTLALSIRERERWRRQSRDLSVPDIRQQAGDLRRGYPAGA